MLPMKNNAAMWVYAGAIVVGALLFGAGYMCGNKAGYEKAEMQAIDAIDIINLSAGDVLALRRFSRNGGASLIGEAILNGIKRGECESFRNLATDPVKIRSHAGEMLVKLNECDFSSDRVRTQGLSVTRPYIQTRIDSKLLSDGLTASLNRLVAELHARSKKELQASNKDSLYLTRYFMACESAKGATELSTDMVQACDYAEYTMSTNCAFDKSCMTFNDWVKQGSKNK